MLPGPGPHNMGANSTAQLRAFFIECSGPHWIGIGRELAEKTDIRPVLWSGDASTVQAAQTETPEIIGVVGVDAARGRLPDAMMRMRSPIDGLLLRALASDEIVGLAMMDRMVSATGAFDHDARRRHWHRLLRQWSGALDALNPDVVIFAMAPHAIYDYALYALCKHRGVRTRMFERAQLPGHVFIVERFEDGSRELREAVRKVSITRAIELSGPMRQHLAQLRGGGSDALPSNYRKKLEKRGLLGRTGRQTNPGLLRTVGFELARAAYVALRKGVAPPHYLVREDQDGQLAALSPFGWLAARWWGQWKKRRLRYLYGRLIRGEPPNVPYVLLTLHYQPERAIVPMAGMYCDQTLIVDLLASALPKNWILVVKEHPWQLVPFSRGELGRSAGFYGRIASHPNVFLAPIEANTENLLLGARAVATATGSTGWQAIARGIPAIVFGTPWYIDAPGVFQIDDFASCRSALAAIEKGGTVPPSAAELMLAALQVVAVPGFLEPGVEDVAHVAEADAVTAMSAVLARSCALHPGGITA